MARRDNGARRRALQAAQATLDELHIDTSSPVDVFDALDRLGLEVTFMRLDNLLGAILPDGGVLLTTERPTSVQRYTAAHEIGHWVLDRDALALDGDIEINGNSPVERERLAQLFAAYFLMPPPLLRGTAARHGLRRGDPATPAQVYVVSRDVGASYEAVARQLGNLDFYPWSHVRTLLDVPPLRAKTDAAFGHRPINGRADVWPLDPPRDGEDIFVRVDDELVLALPENRTTGYRWLTAGQNEARASRSVSPEPPPFAPPPAEPSEAALPAGTPVAGARRSAAAVRRSLQLLPSQPAETDDAGAGGDDDAMRLVGDAYHAGRADLSPRDIAWVRRALAGDPAAASRADSAALQQLVDGPPVGGAGTRILFVRAAAEGTHTLRLVLAPAHDATAAPAVELRITATAAPTPLILHRRRVLSVDLDEQLPGDPADDTVFAVTADPR